jgi:predicted site-specific integrase-resolvase
MQGTVGRIVIAHKDRLARFGFDLYQWLCSQHGCEIVVLNETSLSPEAEMVEDARREVERIVESIPQELRNQFLQEILSSCSRVKES